MTNQTDKSREKYENFDILWMQGAESSFM